jgi:hypothetical protein
MDWVAICSLVFTIPGGIVSSIQIWQMKRRNVAGPTFFRRYPKSFVMAIVLMMIGIGTGSWLVLRSKPPRPLAIQQPAALPEVAQKPESSQQPAPPLKAKPKTSHRPGVPPTTPSVSQSGTGNNQTVIPGGVKQTSSGTNSPNVIGNNNSVSYNTPPPEVPNNSQLAYSANDIARRLRSLQDSINFYFMMKRRENGGAIPIDFYSAQWSRIEPIRTEAVALRGQILKRLPPQAENSTVNMVLVYDNTAGINPLYDVATYFEQLAQQLLLK